MISGEVAVALRGRFVSSIAVAVVLEVGVAVLMPPVDTDAVGGKTCDEIHSNWSTVSPGAPSRCCNTG